MGVRVHRVVLHTARLADGKGESIVETKYGSTSDNVSLEFGLEYNVDIVMCIDATGSMNSLLNLVKRNALKFYDDVMAMMNKKDKHVDDLRVRVIAFRDYIADGENAMLATDFYLLPTEAPEFKGLVEGIKAFGGGDRPEDGLEALAYAIKSDWTTKGTKRRHIIIVWTDDATHELGYARSARNYPTKMARDFDELTDWWGDAMLPGIMDNNAKRLIIFAPEKPYWTTIADNWDNVMMYPSQAAQGLAELDYQQILNAIANSV